ncbi:MAG: 4Fe-4S ferredoxin, partial [Saprospiraceae bacterium]|nr:4Fe-4S ferredoxin [Saprospiraceae bacterium]
MHHDNGIWVSTEDLMREDSFLQSAEKELSLENVDQNGDRWETNRRDFLKLLGFGLGAATIAASCEIPVKKAIPYVTKPDDIVPGVANYFASTIVNGGDYCAVLVKTREGRPIKIEGNTLSSVTKGGTSARAQASVLSLYDNRRIQHAGTVKDGAVTKKEWNVLDREVRAKLASGGNVRVITNTIISPTAKKALAEFTAKYPGARVVTYDPVSNAAMLAANFKGISARVIYNFGLEQANVIVSFGADFLGTWISPVEFARQYAKGRKLEDVKNPKMSRHIQVESHVSLTGSNADNRIMVRPSEQGAAILALH